MKQVLIFAAILLALAVTACDAVPGFAPPPTPTNTPAPTPTTAPTLPPPPTKSPTLAATATATKPAATNVPTPANPLSSLQNIFKGWSSVKSFRAKMTTTGLPTGTQEMTLEVVMPDRFHVTMPQLEAILIAKTVYLKIGTTWQKVALPQGIDVSAANLQQYGSQLGTNSQVKFVGAEVLDGVPTVVYQYTTTIKGPPAQTINTKVWIGVADNLPRKVETSPKAGQTTTIIFSDFNAPITINAPI